MFEPDVDRSNRASIHAASSKDAAKRTSVSFIHKHFCTQVMKKMLFHPHLGHRDRWPSTCAGESTFVEVCFVNIKQGHGHQLGLAHRFGSEVPGKVRTKNTWIWTLRCQPAWSWTPLWRKKQVVIQALGVAPCENPLLDSLHPPITKIKDKPNQTDFPLPNHAKYQQWWTNYKDSCCSVPHLFIEPAPTQPDLRTCHRTHPLWNTYTTLSKRITLSGSLFQKHTLPHLRPKQEELFVYRQIWFCHAGQ